MSTITVPQPSPISASADLSTTRIAGFGGLAFAAGVVAANSFLFGVPTAEAPIAEAAAWLEAHRMRASLATAMVALTFPALLSFGAAMVQLGREADRGILWMLVGALGAAAMVGVFSIVAASQIAAILHAPAGGDAFATAWTIHNGAFAVNMSILGTAFLGFTVGAHAVGAIPGWLRTLGLAGAGLLMVTGFANFAVAAGSPAVFMGFAGFILWLVWVIATSLRLLRSRRAA